MLRNGFVLSCACVWFVASTAVADPLVGWNLNNNGLLNIDFSASPPTPATRGALMSTTTGVTFGGLAYDPLSGVYYGVESSGSRRVFSINVTTGALTQIGSSGIATGGGSLQSLAFDYDNGLLYSTDSFFGNIFAFNVNTGTSTNIGTTSNANIRGLAFDTVNDILYAIPTNTDILTAYTLNATGTAVVGSATTIGSAITGGTITIDGLDYDPLTNTLYALNSAPSNDTLYSINATTGAAQLLTGGIGSSTQLYGLAFAYVIPSAAVVPEPTAVFMWVVCLAAFVGFGCVRRFAR